MPVEEDGAVIEVAPTDRYTCTHGVNIDNDAETLRLIFTVLGAPQPTEVLDAMNMRSDVQALATRMHCPIIIIMSS